MSHRQAENVAAKTGVSHHAPGIHIKETPDALWISCHASRPACRFVSRHATFPRSGLESVWISSVLDKSETILYFFIIVNRF